jgi:hypothetical protein
MGKAKRANNVKKKPIEQYEHKGKKRVNNPLAGHPENVLASW